MKYMPNAIPPEVLNKMSKEDRKPLGKGGRTLEEIAVAHDIKSEKQLQQRCIAMLRLKGYFVIVSRMDRRTSNQIGTPDLIFAVKGQACAFECKLPNNTPTQDQIRVMNHMFNNGWKVRVIHSEEEMRDELRSLETIS